MTATERSWPTFDAWLVAAKEETPVGHALNLHYPSTNGYAPDTCAVCVFYAGRGFTDLTGEPWPCPTVRALMPPPPNRRPDDESD